MANENVKSVGLVELGSMLANGLAFVDMEKALRIVVEKHDGEECVLRSAQPAIAASEENGIVGREAIEETKIVIGPETSQQLLGAIASLPQLRGKFTEQVAEQIAEAREGDADYEKLKKQYEAAERKIETVKAQIKHFDEENVPGFDLESLTKWSPVEDPQPRSFITGSRNGGSRTRKPSAVRWTLNEYVPSQKDVVGAEGAFHNLRLVRTATGWSGLCDEGVVFNESSPNKVMKAILSGAGLSTARSANAFWDGEEQEKAAGVS